MNDIYQLLGRDFVSEQSNDQLFPGRCSDDLLSKVPPFAIWTSEFDYLQRDNLRLAERGKRVGRLLDISMMPGVYHGYMNQPDNVNAIIAFKEEQKQAFDLWVREKTMNSTLNPS